MSRLGTARRTFLELSRRDRGLFVRAWLMLPAVAAAVRVVGFTTLRKALLDGNELRPGRSDPAEARSIARLVDSAANWNPAPASCLVRSLVLCRLLLRRGLAAELRIGIAKPGGDFTAHAWVEHAGAALAEAGAFSEQYTSFDRSVGPPSA